MRAYVYMAMSHSISHDGSVVDELQASELPRRPTHRDGIAGAFPDLAGLEAICLDSAPDPKGNQPRISTLIRQQL